MSQSTSQNQEKGQLNGIQVALESFAIRTTGFRGKLWLKVHAAEQIGEARVRAQQIELRIGSQRH
jgi:hypothetical protein